MARTIADGLPAGSLENLTQVGFLRSLKYQSCLHKVTGSASRWRHGDREFDISTKVLARSLRTFGIFGEFENKRDVEINIDSVLRAVTALGTKVTASTRSLLLRYAPAVVSIAFIGILAINRVAATGSAMPVADLGIGRGSEVVLDEISSADVSAMAADMADMVVADQAIARAETLATQTDLASATEDSLVKPQIVDTDTKSRADIVKHLVADGETLDSIANQYNITTNTIKWANNITRDRVDVGTELTILPLNGILHTVTDADTPDSLAQFYRANAKQIVAFNDAEVDGLVAGQQVVIPEGVKPAPRTTAIARNSTFTRGRFVFSTNWTYLGRYTQFPNPGGYGRGWCTHWAAYRAGVLGNPIGNSWGNAISWPSSARSSGNYVVDHTPRVGAVAQRGNHVTVVEAVSEDGSMIRYSDMNGVGGWGNAVIYNDWVPASSFAWYIYHK